MDWMANPESWIALASLTALEIVLGIDNIVFLTVLAAKLPEHQQDHARRIGLLLAMIMRIALLLGLAWIIRLTQPLFTTLGQEISGRDLILIVGGLFLLAKSTHEIHLNLEGVKGGRRIAGPPSLAGVLVQIALLDIVFSLDSVITAVGMVREIPIMVIAIVLAVGVMLLFARPIGNFVERHPTVKILALSFLLLVGVALIADGLDQHFPRGYIYFAMGFSVFVEMLNLRMKQNSPDPVHLRHAYSEEPEPPIKNPQD